MDLDIMVDDGDMDWAVIYANLIPEGKGKLLWKLFTIVWKGKRREETSEKSLHPHQHRAGSGQLLLSLTWAPCSLTSLKLLYQHHHHHHPFLHPQFCSVQPLSRVRLFATPWTAACRASLSITNSQNLLKLMSIQLVMPSNHAILCHPLLLLLSIFPASGSFLLSQFFTSGGQSIGASASALVLPVNIQGWFPLGSCGLILQSKGLSRVFSNTTVQKHQFFGAQLSSESTTLTSIHDYWKHHSFD